MSTLESRMTTALAATSATVRADQHEAGTRFQIRRIDAGRLLLPTGRLCVADAYSADVFPSLNRIVAPGEYPVELVIAELPKNLHYGDDRCAFVVVTFADEPVANWDPVTAVQPADPCFTAARPNGFVQEGATALFSPEAGTFHFRRLREGFDRHLTFLREQSRHFGSRDWLNYSPDPNSPAVVIVEGGMGDGTYECFVGLSAAGRVLRVVIDFRIAEPLVD